MKILIDKCPRCEKRHEIELSQIDIESNHDQINFPCPNRKRLPRLTNFHFDFTRNASDDVLNNKDVLSAKYGEMDIEDKVTRWKESSGSSIWLFPDYREKMDEVVASYISGNYFCTITGACCLIERALNVLVIEMRDSYELPEKWKKAIGRDSHIQNWEACWSTLHSWGVFNDDQKKLCKKLHRTRNNVCHYDPSFIHSEQAILVLKDTNQLFDSLFSVLDRRDIFNVFEIPGEIWVKESAMSLPFVKKFVNPLCSMMTAHSKFKDGVYYEYDQGCDNISESDFVRSRIEFNSSPDEHREQDVFIPFEHEGKKWKLRIL